MEVMLDTNAYCDWLRAGTWGDEIAYANSVSLSTVVLGELYHGFHGGNRYSENVRRLRDFLDQPPVIVCDVTEEVSEAFGELLAFLQSQGTPLPTNDVWIAAGAYVRRATLLTCDRHFERLPQVKVLWPER